VEKGLGTSSGSDELRLGPGEILMVHLLCDLLASSKAKSDFDPKLVKHILFSGHTWALDWAYAGLFNFGDSRDNSAAVRSEVLDILELWEALESGYEELSVAEKKRVAAEGKMSEGPRFPGFDANNEGTHLSVARLLVEHLDRFPRFKKRILNSHARLLEGYQRMVAAFAPMKRTLAGGELSVSQIIEILNARMFPKES
jgi:uncharacterized protein YfbU (UPF0304 family)